MVNARDIFDKFKRAKAVRAVASLAEFVGGGGITAPPEVIAERMALCEACPYFTPGEYPTCKDCGCFLKLKTAFPQEECPQGKWLPVARPPLERKPCTGC